MAKYNVAVSTLRERHSNSDVSGQVYATQVQAAARFGSNKPSLQRGSTIVKWMSDPPRFVFYDRACFMARSFAAGNSLEHYARR